VPRKRIVCLANSTKQGGRCVAGLELGDEDMGLWVRPIGADEGHGLSLTERRCTDGNEPMPLDVVDIAVVAPAPVGHQPENWTLDTSVMWETIGTLDYEKLHGLVEAPPELWPAAQSSTVGIRDRVPGDALKDVANSIYFLQPQELKIIVETNHWSGQREVRARFSYGEREYQVKVSDPVYKREYLHRPEGAHAIPEGYITVSLAEAWVAPNAQEAYAYIVVAAIIEPTGAPGAGV
jgi:hypothetical protein